MNAVTPAEGGSPVIFVALEDGTVKVLDRSGELLRQGKVDGTPVRVLKLVSGQVAVGLESGGVLILGLYDVG